MLRVTRTLVISLAFLALSPYSHADEIHAPFAINVEDFKTDAKAHGFDLYDQKDSQGFVENRGSSFVVYTYRTATPEQLDLVKDLTWRHRR